MTILQVKEYHNSVAYKKEQMALECWRNQGNGYGYPVPSMFYFMLSDKHGYPTKKRKNGYVAFNETTAVFAMNETEARKKFNNRI